MSNYTYNTQQLIANSQYQQSDAGLSASDSFTIAVNKGGTTTNIPIDLSQVSGPLTLGNIVSYINSQLSADGFSTRFQITEQGDTATSDAAATYGLQITPGGNETISLSAASTPALYLVGNSGNASEVNTTRAPAPTPRSTPPPPTRLAASPRSAISAAHPPRIVSANQDATTGTTTAQATAVDFSGNIYVLGNATGNIGSDINQGTQDVYLTKYDSAGNVVWQNLVGSAGTASGYGIALDPAGGVVITGTSTADITPTSVGDGNNDFFVASYDANGNQNWIQQIQPWPPTRPMPSALMPAAISISAAGLRRRDRRGPDSAGRRRCLSGQIRFQRQSSGGKPVRHLGADQVSATATGSDGSLYVASVQNGDAVMAKYANGDITSSMTLAVL